MAEDKNNKNKAPKELVETTQEEDILAPEEEIVKPDKIDTTSLLEVEEMPESSELQKRREQTQSKLKQLAEVPEEEGDAFSNQGERTGIMDLIRESGLSGRHFTFCCSGILVLAIIGGIVYASINGGFDFLKHWFDQKSNETVDETPTPEDVQDSDQDLAVQYGILIGGAILDEDQSTDLGEFLGSVASNSEFAQIVNDLQMIYSGTNQDIFELLDQSKERATSLENYIDRLKYLQALGKTNIDKLQVQNRQIEQEFINAENNRDAFEEEFFVDLGNLDGNASSTSLNDYINHAQIVVNLRAKFRARERLIDYYSQVLEDLALRITDIEFNKEAIVKGVKIIDIQGSDLNLIIDESEF